MHVHRSKSSTDELLKAVEHCQKALATEPAKGCAGAHKWYALAIGKLAQVDHKLGKVVNAAEEAKKHLERAVQIDPKDAYAWLYLGKQHYHRKDYTEAVKCFQKGE